MSVFVYGTSPRGRVEYVPGLFHVATRFFHLWHLPLIPLGSELVGTSRCPEATGRRVPLNGRSVLAAYARAYGGLAAVVGGAASSFALSDFALRVDVWPAVCWAASGVLLLLAVRLPLRFGFWAGLSWLALTGALAVVAWRHHAAVPLQPRSWAAVGVGLGLVWLVDGLWRNATPERALALAARAGLPADLILARLPAAPEASADD